MDLNSLINIASGNTQVAIQTTLLKKSQDLQAGQVMELVKSMSKGAPSPQGVGRGLDIYA